MSNRKRRKAMQGVVGAAGVVAALGGFIGGYYSTGTTIFLTFAIWILGTAVVNAIWP